ncbi:MAG: hypothetical protein ACE5LB_17630 [Acidiferrobacterales bacterium]
MATLTIRNLPERLVRRLKTVARQKGRSMEQEVRELLQTRYAPRSEVLSRVRKRWETLPETTADEAQRWRVEGRPE